MPQNTPGLQRLSDGEALSLFESASLPALSLAAHARRQQLNPSKIVTYIIDRNVNYTNVCLADCSFCAFYRKIDDPESYVLTREQLAQKIDRDAGARREPAPAARAACIPKLKLEWYEDMLRWMKAEFGIHLHAFSAPEIHAFSKINKMTTRKCSAA
jgi:cyclic dehypoxanthinyl futalosine synthase